MGALNVERVQGAVRQARWQVLRIARRVLRTRGTGPVLLMAAAASALIAGVTLFTLSRQAQAVRVELAAARRAPPEARASAPLDDTETLQRFYAELPVADALPAVIEDLIRLGGEQQVSLSVGEYRVQSDAGKAASYRIRFPVVGDAAAIQHFVLEALNRYPTLALEALSMRRENIASTRVEANIQFNLLFARGTGAP
jgi:hypothetical protein